MGLVIALQSGRPSIHVDTSAIDDGVILVVPTCLTAPDGPVIAARLNELIG